MVKLANPNPRRSATLNEFFPLASVVWSALEKVGAKQKLPDDLPEGSSHDVQLQVSGTVDGIPFEQAIHSVVSIGHGQTRSSSVNPQVPQLLAYLLSKLNSATRDRILIDIPNDFRDNGNQLPDAGAVLIDEAKQLLKSLRETKTVEARSRSL